MQTSKVLIIRPKNVENNTVTKTEVKKNMKLPNLKVSASKVVVIAPPLPSLGNRGVLCV